MKPVGGDELDALAKEVAKPSTEVIERLKLLLGISWSQPANFHSWLGRGL